MPNIVRSPSESLTTETGCALLIRSPDGLLIEVGHEVAGQLTLAAALILAVSRQSLFRWLFRRRR